MRNLLIAALLLLAVTGGARAQIVGDLTAPGCTVAATDTVCLAAATAGPGVYRHVQIQNVSASATIACRWGAAATMNDKQSILLTTGQAALWGPLTAGAPYGALHCIASAGSTPLYVEWN